MALDSCDARNKSRKLFHNEGKNPYFCCFRTEAEINWFGMKNALIVQKFFTFWGRLGFDSESN